MAYDVSKEYENISDYSPFCHVNEVSEEYRFNQFLLPFIDHLGEARPVHPDTFKDLSLDPQRILYSLLVHPTSSFRTVFYPEKNICYKLPLLRKITRGIRDLPKKELQRSERAKKLISMHKFQGFFILPEICHYADDPHFNYIERKMPDEEVHPWFYVIKSKKFSDSFIKEVSRNMIRSWMFFASKNIFLEYHMQNILVDDSASIYYRDLSDVKSYDDELLRPSYQDSVLGIEDVRSVIFDRAMCRQNLDHVVKYTKSLGSEYVAEMKQLIKTEMKNYGLRFPDYSMDFPESSPQRIPVKTKLVDWRDF